MDIAGYNVSNPLHVGAKTTLYRAIRRSDARPVVLKTLNALYPSPRALDRLKREFSILQRFDTPNIIRALALEAYGNSLLLVMEDFESITLSEHLGGKALELESFFDIAVE